MEHVFVEHEKCPNPGRCMICDGGLALCALCGCGEGGLPTDCPGYNCYAEYGDAIHRGEIDFVDGEWVKSSSVHSPASYREKAA